jgi:hypothetical protein
VSLADFPMPAVLDDDQRGTKLVERLLVRKP